MLCCHSGSFFAVTLQKGVTAASVELVSSTTASADINSPKCSCLPGVITYESEMRGGGARGERGTSENQKINFKMAQICWQIRRAQGASSRPDINWMDDDYEQLVSTEMMTLRCLKLGGGFEVFMLIKNSEFPKCDHIRLLKSDVEIINVCMDITGSICPLWWLWYTGFLLPAG